MTLLWLVSQHVNRQKRDLLQYLLDNDACDAERAVDLSYIDVKPSILRSMISRKIVMRAPSGGYYVDRSRVNQAYGASNSFILYAMGAFLLAFLLIMLW